MAGLVGREQIVHIALGATSPEVRRRAPDLLGRGHIAGVLVDGHELRRGQKRRLVHRSELSLGGRGLVYRLHAAGPRTGRWE